MDTLKKHSLEISLGDGMDESNVLKMGGHSPFYSSANSKSTTGEKGHKNVTMVTSQSPNRENKKE